MTVIKDLRIQLNMTQKQVAELTNYSIATISRVENDSKFVSDKTKENIIKKLETIKYNISCVKTYEKTDKLLKENNNKEAKIDITIPVKENWWVKIYNFIINLIR